MQVYESVLIKSYSVSNGEVASFDVKLSMPVVQDVIERLRKKGVSNS